MARRGRSLTHHCTGGRERVPQAPAAAASCGNAKTALAPAPLMLNDGRRGHSRSAPEAVRRALNDGLHGF